MIHYRSVKPLLGLATFISLLLSSCGSPKRYAYLQDVEFAKRYSVEFEHQIVVEPGDRLQISVQSTYPELVAPFNGEGFQSAMPSVGAGKVAVAGSSSALQESQALRSFGYTVDEKGEINFPVLGYIKVAGLNLEGVAKHLEALIKKSKYVTDPRVEVMFSNFQIYMLGASKPENTNVYNSSYNSYGNNQYMSFTPINTIGGGVLRISDKKSLSILEALAYMGDLPMNANAEKVMVIRKINGQFVSYRLNMKSTDIYTSPAFYLKQNDIVYVEPMYRRTENEGIDRILQVAGYGFSSIASIVAIVALFKK